MLYELLRRWVGSSTELPSRVASPQLSALDTELSSSSRGRPNSRRSPEDD